MKEDTQNSWKTVPLGTLAQFRNGINYTKDNFGRGIKIISVKDFQDYLVPKYEDLDEINPEGIIREESLLRDEDIVFVRSNGNRELIGRSLFIHGLQEKVTHSAFTIKAHFNSDITLPRFYAYLFRTSLIRQGLSAYGGGTNISNLNQEILSNLQVPLPPLSFQKRIVEILSAYDDLIENNMQRIKILEKIVQAIYSEWFVNFRFPGHEKVKMVESKIGKVPEGWEVKTFGELLNYNIGGGWGEEEKNDKFSIAAYVIRGTDIPKARNISIENCPLRYHKQSNLLPRILQTKILFLKYLVGVKANQ